MSTESKVIELVAETLEASPDDIEPGDRFVEDLGIDSLDTVNLVWRVEEAFSLPETPRSVLEGVETVDDLARLVDRIRMGDISEIDEATRVVVAADHAGVHMKTKVVEWLLEAGEPAVDLGPAETHSVDYPDFAELVARQVADGRARRGILICGSGIGMSIAANKVAGVRAALVTDPLMAKLARKHNDANVLCIGSRIIGSEMARACVEAFLEADFDPGDDGRHRRRVGRIGEIERESGC
ncbi:MAG: ribose 5-phosphate isomerase B [Persicimonas sp.]